MAKKKIDVLFINPGSVQAVYQDLSDEFSAIETPSMTALFAGFIRNKGLSVDLIDIPALGLSPEEAASKIERDYEPTLIAMVVYGFQPSASTQNMTAAGQTCTAIKKKVPLAKILITGTHPAALPKRTIDEEDVDFVCSQEGPQTILGVLQFLKGELPDLQAVPSLVYRKEGHIISTPHGELLSNLDVEMPGAAWDLLPMDRYRAHNWHCFEDLDHRKPYASIHTTLGCPYRCTFCCINAPFGKSSYRMWSPQAVIKEIDILVTKYHVKNIKIVDEMFVLHRQHVLGICDLIIQRGYDLNIWAYARVDTVKEEFLDKLKRAGVRWLALGIESASKHVRDGVLKGRFGREEILQVVRNIQNAGINVIGNYIFGLPDDTFESMQETLDLAFEANCEFANFYSAMAYPGSKLYTMAIENGWELPSTWVGYSQHSYETKPMRTEALTAAEVLRFRDEAFIKYYSDLRYLSFVEKKFGTHVRVHVEKMTKIQLKRKILEPTATLAFN